MSGPMARPVRIRLSGDLDDVRAVADMLRVAQETELISESRPHPTRRGPGVRVYVDVLVLRAAQAQ